MGESGDTKVREMYRTLKLGRAKRKVLFEITTFCNLNCPFCFNASSYDKHKIMTFDDFKVMIDKIKEKEISIELSGGEPFSHPDIEKMIDYLIQCELPFNINTNGMLVTENILDKIVDYGRGTIQLSLDGASSEVDDVIRCEGHFDKIYSLMLQLNEKGFKGGILRMVINRLNYNQIEEYFYLALRNNFIPTYSFLVKSGRAGENWGNLCIDDCMKYEARSNIVKLIDENEEYFRKIRHETYVYYLKNMNINYEDKCRFNDEECGFTPLIHVDGSAQPCEGLFQEEFCIGNLLVQKFEEIYSKDNVLVKEIIFKAQKRRKHLEEDECHKCAINKMCGKGCLAEAYNKGDFYGKPSWCEVRKRDFLDTILKQGGV